MRHKQTGDPDTPCMAVSLSTVSFQIGCLQHAILNLPVNQIFNTVFQQRQSETESTVASQITDAHSVRGGFAAEPAATSNRHMLSVLFKELDVIMCV